MIYSNFEEKHCTAAASTIMPPLERSSTPPCGACKHLRRKCITDCPFAPYFPPNDPHKFALVHTVYGASNVLKIIEDLQPEHRAFTLESLVFEAKARLSNPVHGCFGIIYDLRGKIEEVQSAIANARQELSMFIGPAAFGPLTRPFAFDPQDEEGGRGGGGWIQQQNETRQYEAMSVDAEAIRELQLMHEIISSVQQQQNEDQYQHMCLPLDQCQHLHLGNYLRVAFLENIK